MDWYSYTPYNSYQYNYTPFWGGLHFLLRVDTQLSDGELTAFLEGKGIRIQALSHYYHTPGHENSHCFVVNYAGIREESIPAALASLKDIM